MRLKLARHFANARIDEFELGERLFHAVLLEQLENVVQRVLEHPMIEHISLVAELFRQIECHAGTSGEIFQIPGLIASNRHPSTHCLLNRVTISIRRKHLQSRCFPLVQGTAGHAPLGLPVRSILRDTGDAREAFIGQHHARFIEVFQQR